MQGAAGEVEGVTAIVWGGRRGLRPASRVVNQENAKGKKTVLLLRNTIDPDKFNRHAELPYELRLDDFRLAMQDVYDFFYDVNSHLSKKGLQRLDDMLRPAIMSGVLSAFVS